ncbi:MAG: LamG domain-containing protein, partial [Phycisphaerales bacterium]
TAMVPGVWYHVVGVYSEGNYIRTYVDGDLDREMTTSEILGSSTGPLMIGIEPFPAADGTYGGFFNGLIDELKIYSRALSDAEVAWLAGRTDPFSEPFDFNVDDTVDFLDVAILGDEWLEELTWPVP